ncbi:MAG: hypothetical protein A3C69_02710 [Candidatus Yanofskybacteria bacterium RIFCSPHIGHO2_02_FULL_43_12]|nr:MAG: hypothetical protein A3C69_02710 [Candidatus Yanofskybacteria bacterium RIFCSPHIGHO2_02_FULL_43_12]
MPSEKDSEALFAWFLNNAERQERFAAHELLRIKNRGIISEVLFCERFAMTREKYKANVDKIVERECKNGKHTLVKIYESGGDMESDVVRWCIVCGSITVDTDYDDRTDPGAVLKMKSPLITKALS